MHIDRYVPDKIGDTKKKQQSKSSQIDEDIDKVEDIFDAHLDSVCDNQPAKNQSQGEK